MGDRGSILFAGCARDCARFLPLVLKNIERISTLSSESACAVFENDSADATSEILSNWGNGQANFILANYDGLGRLPQRTERLALARNSLVEIIRAWTISARFEFVFMLDFDDAAASELDLAQISRAIEWMKSQGDVAAVFPNQIGTFFDMWALRHGSYCPGDIWEEVLDYKLAHACDSAAAFEATFKKRAFALRPDSPPLQVDSAFGGLGIYRLDYYLRNKNPYLGHKVKLIGKAGKPSIVRLQQCEHVHFHLGLRNLGGKLFVMPGLINGDATGKQIQPSFVDTLIF